MRTPGTLTSAFISWRARPPLPMTATLSVSLAPRTFTAGTTAIAAVLRNERRVELVSMLCTPHLSSHDASLPIGCHAHAFAWAWRRLHAHAKPWAWHLVTIAPLEEARCLTNVVTSRSPPPSSSLAPSSPLPAGPASSTHD